MRYFLPLTLICILSCTESESRETEAADSSDTPTVLDTTPQPIDSGVAEEDSSSTGAVGPPAQNLMVTVEAGGFQRQYRLYVPTTRDGTSMSLIIAVHGGGGGAGVPFQQEEQFRMLSEYERVILAFPIGINVGNNEADWQLNTTSDRLHDIEFIGTIIDDIGSRYALDESRVYATGYSLGSMFVYELACHMGDRFAAIASHAGSMPLAPVSCDPEVFVPIMHIHGVADSIIPYSTAWDWKAWDSVGTMTDIPGLISYWSGKYGCQTVTEEETSSSTHIVHSDCQQGVRVEHHRLPGDHGWPFSLNGAVTPQVLWWFLSEFTR